jgi:hypothetical protein
MSENPHGSGGPEIHQIRDAEIRIFNREPGTDDASDMYVIEVLGVTVLIRKVREEQRELPKVVVETKSWPMLAEVCGIDTMYGDY